jgi:hypothetical protein
MPQGSLGPECSTNTTTGPQRWLQWMDTCSMRGVQSATRQEHLTTYTDQAQGPEAVQVGVLVRSGPIVGHKIDCKHGGGQLELKRHLGVALKDGKGCNQQHDSPALKHDLRHQQHTQARHRVGTLSGSHRLTLNRLQYVRPQRRPTV